MQGPIFADMIEFNFVIRPMLKRPVRQYLNTMFYIPRVAQSLVIS